MGGRDGGYVIQHVQLMHILEGHLLPELQIYEVQSLLGGQLILAEQFHQEWSEPCETKQGINLGCVVSGRESAP